jgi:hypothetical protein
MHLGDVWIIRAPDPPRSRPDEAFPRHRHESGDDFTRAHSGGETQFFRVPLSGLLDRICHPAPSRARTASSDIICFNRGRGRVRCGSRLSVSGARARRSEIGATRRWDTARRTTAHDPLRSSIETKAVACRDPLRCSPPQSALPCQSALPWLSGDRTPRANSGSDGQPVRPIGYIHRFKAA